MHPMHLTFHAPSASVQPAEREHGSGGLEDQAVERVVVGRPEEAKTRDVAALSLLHVDAIDSCMQQQPRNIRYIVVIHPVIRYGI